MERGMDSIDLERARERLRKWANPQASGNPTKRMVAIWPRGPMAMAIDVARVLDALDERERAA